MRMSANLSCRISQRVPIFPAERFRWSAASQRTPVRHLNTMALQKPPIWLVLDFDGTMTVEDTTSIIGSKCIAKAQELAPPTTPSEKLPHPMSYYGERYFKEYKEWKDSHVDTPPRKTIAEEVAHLSKSKPVELNSFLRVREAVVGTPGGIADLARDDVSRNAFMIEAGREAIRSGEVRIRDCEVLRSLLAKAREGENKWGIVSVSFSRRFIMGVLAESGLLDDTRIEGMAADVKSKELLAPLVDTDDLSVPCSAADKQRALDRLLTSWGSNLTGDGQAAQKPVTIYVGDSSTDIGCLAQASFGLYICKDSATDPLVQTLTKLDVDCIPLAQFKGHLDRTAQKPGETRQTIYTFQNFSEVNEWLSSLQ